MRLTGNLKSWATMRLAMKRTPSPLIRQRATSTCPSPVSAADQRCMLPSIIRMEPDALVMTALAGRLAGFFGSIIRMEPDALVMKAGGTIGTLIQVLIPEYEGHARSGRA